MLHLIIGNKNYSSWSLRPWLLLRMLAVAAIILVIPIVIPLIEQAGIDPVHFGLVVTLNLAIGQQTPVCCFPTVTDEILQKRN